MTPADARRALFAILTVCVVILLVCGIYLLAEYRAGTKRTASIAKDNTAMPMIPLQREPLEIRGLEGVLTPQGLLVTAAEGQARLSGVRVGDVVTRTNGQSIHRVAQLQQPAPTTTAFTVQRQGQRLDLMPTAAAVAQQAQTEARVVDVRGLHGQVTARGLWVKSVDGDAARWGLRRGDLLRRVNGRPLHVRRDATVLLRDLQANGGLVFELVRNGAQVYLPYNPGGTQPMASPPFGNATPRAGVRAGGAAMVQHGQQTPGLGCPVCGARHPAGWGGGACWRCGASVAAAAPGQGGRGMPAACQLTGAPAAGNLAARR